MAKLGNFNLSVALKTDDKDREAADVRMEWFPNRMNEETASTDLSIKEGPVAVDEIIVSGSNGFNKIIKAWKAFMKNHWPNKE